MRLPKLEEYQGILVARDDLLPGGTKSRLLAPLFKTYAEIVYATPAYGGAQLALAYAAREAGKKATLFVARRAKPHARTLAAVKAGATVYQVPHGYLSHVQAKAKRYAEDRGAHYLEFGAEEKGSLEKLKFLGAMVWASLGPFDEVWSAAGSGVLTRGLQAGMPCEFHAVLVGKDSDTGRAIRHRASIPFEKEEKRPAPFPSCPNYDRKAWHLCLEKKGRGRILFWNVLG